MALEGEIVSISEGAKYRGTVYDYNAEIRVNGKLISFFDSAKALEDVKEGDLITFEASILTNEVEKISKERFISNFDNSHFNLTGEIIETSDSGTKVLLKTDLGEIWIKNNLDDLETDEGMWIKVKGIRMDIEELVK